MWALLAAFAFAVAIILHLAKVGYVDVTALAGLLCLALHLAFGWPLPWRRPAVA